MNSCRLFSPFFHFVAVVRKKKNTHQLEVCHSHRALLIHLLLVFVLNQTVHQLAGVNLVVSHLLADRRRKKTVHFMIA